MGKLSEQYLQSIEEGREEEFMEAVGTGNKIYKQIPLIMAKLGAIAKTSRNEAQNYSFRGIDDMYNAVHSVLAAHSVFACPMVREKSITETVTSKGNRAYHVLLTVEHRFYADDGSYVSVITAGEGLDSSDKATPKAMSCAMKYAFIELFSIPTDDVEDAERGSEELGSNGGGEKGNGELPKPKVTIKPKNSAVQYTDASTPDCSLCRAQMRVSKNGDAYTCPNWKDKKNGDHDYIKIEKPEELFNSDIAL